LIDRPTFDLIKQRHGSYASWAIWAEPDGRPKSNIGDLCVLDPDQNPVLLQALKNDVVMIGLNISRPLSEPLRNFHDASPRGQDYKIRYAFSDSPLYGAYMTDLIKGVVMLESASLTHYLSMNPFVVAQNVERLMSEFSDLGCDHPTVITFGANAHRLFIASVPRSGYSRLFGVTHYSHHISKEAYRTTVLGQIGLGQA